MAAQTTYEIHPSHAYEGMIYGIYEHDTWSFAAEGNVEPGRVVARGTASTKQCVQGLGGAEMLGISIRSVEREAGASGNLVFSDTETVPVMRTGYVYVRVVNGATSRDEVVFDDVTGEIYSGTATLGQSTLTGATFETEAAAGEIAVVRLGNSLGAVAGS